MSKSKVNYRPTFLKRSDMAGV